MDFDQPQRTTGYARSSPAAACWLLVALIAALLLGSGSTVAADEPPLRIDGPEPGEVVRGLVYVTGRAVWPDPERFAFFQLLVGPGNDPAPTSLQPVSPRVDQPRTGGFLAVWDTGDLPAGDYTLVLVVDDVDGNELQARVSVVVEAAPARPTATSAPTVRPESGSPEAIPPESAPPVATLPLPLEPLPTRSPFAPVYEPAREPTATPYLPRPLPTPGGEPALAPIPTPLPVPPPLIPTQAPPVFPPTPPVPTPPGVP